jgi:hypothetical protein
MKKKILIGIGLLVVALVLIVLAGGERQPTADNFPKPTSQPEEFGVKGLKIN